MISRHGYDAFTIEALTASDCYGHRLPPRGREAPYVMRSSAYTRAASWERCEMNRRAQRAGPSGHGYRGGVAAHAIRPAGSSHRSLQNAADGEWLTTSPMVTRFATDVLGQVTPDPLAQQWLIRTVLALWFWPLKDPEAELRMVERFLGPPYLDGT